MEVYRRSSWLLLILTNISFFIILQGVQGEFASSEGPSESDCRPHIEKALKQLEVDVDLIVPTGDVDSKEDLPTVELTTDDLFPLDDNQELEFEKESSEIELTEDNQFADEVETYNNNDYMNDDINNDNSDDDNDNDSDDDNNSNNDSDNDDNANNTDNTNTSNELEEQIITEELEAHEEHVSDTAFENLENELLQEQNDEPVNYEDINVEELPDWTSIDNEVNENDNDNLPDDEIGSSENNEIEELESIEHIDDAEVEEFHHENSKEEDEMHEHDIEEQEQPHTQQEVQEPQEVIIENEQENDAEESEDNIETAAKESISESSEKISNKEEDSIEIQISNLDEKGVETDTESDTEIDQETPVEQESEVAEVIEEAKKEEPAVEELTKYTEEDLANLRPRDHVAQMLKLDSESEQLEQISQKTSEIVLKELKKLYENAIKPLEFLYKYRDLSNRHFGDSEIFSKPLILFMGPWSGGKSTIINYLLDIEHNDLNLHTGAEPSPAYFNILMHGNEPEILDGTELVADYTFSGLQKFGQGLEERLRGYKFPSKLLQKVNVVEIPGILEVRKQVSRIFPFNDACQWFIDRADIIFLVYDPSKLDVGPETEAILDQLKGREHQTRIVLNKADQVKPEELMRVQGALIWNISPLMSSAQPPVMYTTSLWSQPYEQWAPIRLLQAQERALLRDIRSAIDKKIDNKISSARRFAVRVRNHAKMVDCYLTTYYNHKSVFGNRKQVSDEIINHPQDYHIYEGLSTLTNISRYDLPDPDVYRDFFRLNALYDFQKLSSTCTYFRGCPINRLDVAIAYDLPELIGKHKHLIEAALSEAATRKSPSGS